MRRALTALCVLLTAALPFLFWSVRGELPGDTSALVREKYDSWAGVLRLWVFEGWQADAVGWLNRAGDSFEASHAGVYIQVRKVDAQALCALSDSGIEPPDMIAFPPGLLDGPEGLLPLSGLPALRDELAGYADGCAVPVAMGAYALAESRSSGGAASAACSPAGAYCDPPVARMLMQTGGGAQAEAPEPPGLDLGLPASATADGATGDAPAPSEDAYAAFTRAEADAVVITQAEARRLAALSEAGRGPDWTARATGEAMLADQLLLVGVVERQRADMDARAQLCMAFIAHLLDAQVQAELAETGALPVLEGLSIYAGQPGFEALEAASSLPLLVPPAFGGAGRAALAAVREAYLAGEIDADEGLARLRAAFSGAT